MRINLLVATLVSLGVIGMTSCSRSEEPAATEPNATVVVEQPVPASLPTAETPAAAETPATEMPPAAETPPPPAAEMPPAETPPAETPAPTDMPAPNTDTNASVPDAGASNDVQGDNASGSVEHVNPVAMPVENESPAAGAPPMDATQPGDTMTPPPSSGQEGAPSTLTPPTTENGAMPPAPEVHTQAPVVDVSGQAAPNKQ